MDQGTGSSAVRPIGHPGIKQEPKGDPRIIAELEHVRWRNRNRDNPNLLKGTIYYDFAEGRIRIEGEA